MTVDFDELAVGVAMAHANSQLVSKGFAQRSLTSAGRSIQKNKPVPANNVRVNSTVAKQHSGFHVTQQLEIQ